MNTLNPTQASALEKLAGATRTLITQVVETDADTEDINAIIADINLINQRLQGLPKGRRVAHYDLAMATTNTNHTLPYSPVCGPFNPLAPPVDMHYDAEARQVIGRVRCGLPYEGPKHMVHGAVIAAIYDQLLALASACLGQPSFTAYLHTDYKSPTPLHEELVFRAWIASVDGRKMIIRGNCTLNDQLLTESEGLFIELKR